MKLARFSLCLIAAVALAPLAQADEEARDPRLLKAVELRGQAVSAFGAGDYDAAAELARRAKAELALISGAAGATAPATPLPATYTVRLIPEQRDCLTKIAGYPFVYGDPERWPVLYNANKATLRHPENADIIIPGEVLVIPSLAGEPREGSFDPSFEYRTMD
jgi:nucleoid-associated protein YgaU